ncbi:hypothetical protein [Dictyobacter arantiisoli]|uniref:ABC transporter permease n=1 Tax=Dictyobacter arantiisoli TaxID=2014874 RepID=A0A5A5T6S4_9CHLR|nr:hypothetical protein [Dictyobacter arantiisoli]GCF07102.1 hypothetical protein KDI_06660 [Dictyobacter arantiisoli]
MLWRAILLEKDKVYGRLILWIELAILVALIVLIDVLEFVVGQNLPGSAGALLVDGLTWPRALTTATQFAGSHTIGGILLVIVIGVITSREYSWRTFHLWLSRGVSRTLLLEAKCIVIFLLSLTIVVISLIISVILTGIFTLIVHNNLQIDQVQWGTIIQNFLITDYGLLPYAALTFVLTILSRSSIVSISVVLVLILLVEPVAYNVFMAWGGIGMQIVQYLPLGLEYALNSAVNSSTPSVFLRNVPAPWLAVLGIALYTLIFTGIAIWRFLYQEFTD